ncbi:MAG: NlpC/P60 family protein [Defluviitaleaceae bacterium]|nr:NlpC/P60 family protein [Defluviitaleaceae bacterium]
MIFSIQTIQTSVAPLYEHPCTQSQRVDEVLYGMAVSVKAKENDWLFVSTPYRYEGWIHYSNLIDAKLITRPSSQVYYVNIVAADVLVAPKVQAPLLVCLTLGCIVRTVDEIADEVDLSQEKSGWTKIYLVDGRIGYIRSTFISQFPKSVSRESLCETAKLYLGTQYRWGGKTPLGIDCSGLCSMAYWLNGVVIYRDARIKPGFPIKKISPAYAQKGDLLFFPGHVGMMLDKTTMIHASEANKVVKIESLTKEWIERLTEVGSLWSIGDKMEPIDHQY